MREVFIVEVFVIFGGAIRLNVKVWMVVRCFLASLLLSLLSLLF